MAKDYEKIYNEHIDVLKGKIDLIKIKLKADANRLKITGDYITFRDNYIKYVNEDDLNHQYPPTPKSLDGNIIYLAKAMNEGRKILLSLQKFFESQSKAFFIHRQK